MARHDISSTRGETPFKKTGTIQSAVRITKEQRLTLIGKGNQCLQRGNIEQAEKIFSTLNYYDGINRVAQLYMERGKILEAFMLFNKIGAENEKKTLAHKIAKGIQQWLQDDTI